MENNHPSLLLPHVELVDWAVMDLPSWNFDQSLYRCWRLYWNDRPGAYVVKQQEMSVDPEHVVVVPPLTSVDLRMTSPVRHVYFCVNAEVSHAVPSRHVWRFALEPVLKGCLEEICAGTRQVGRIGVDAVLLTSWCLAQIPDEGWEESQLDERIQLILEVIDRSLGEDLSNAQLSSLIHLAPNSFGRLFEASLGLTPRQYILRKRLEMAAQMLVSGGESIEAIAAQCGFCDRYYFTRMFTQKHQVSPAVFRRTHRGRPARES